MKLAICFVLAVGLNLSLFSQITDGYYYNAEGLSGENLKSALNNLYIDYFFESNKYPSISFYNIQGNLIQTFHFSDYETINHRVSLNLNRKNILSGIYFYKFEIDDFHHTGKLIFK